MIVAGVGCRKDATSRQIVHAVHAALIAHGLENASIGLLATGEIKRGNSGLLDASLELDAPLIVFDDARLKAAASRCVTSSPASLESTGLPSLSEASALVAAGPGGRLRGPRLVLDGVTCALGETAEAGT